MGQEEEEKLAGKDICLSSPLLLARGEEVGRRQGAGWAVVIVGPGPASSDKTPW